MSQHATLGPEIDASNFNIILALFGGFACVLGLMSHTVKDRLFISETLVALLIGIALGPLAGSLIRPDEYGNVDTITLAFARLVLGIQLVLAGIQLPSLYVWHHWKTIAILLLPIMAFKWIISALVIYLIFPLTYLEALVIGACITPTDPVLANAIVKGRYAEKHVPPELRALISAEAGANDGFGYPFLFLAIYLLKAHSRGEATADWFVHTWLYEVCLSIVFGICLGLVARLALRYATQKKWADQEAFNSFFLVLSLSILGCCGLVGTDDLLAAFVAGNAFSLGDFYRDETEDCTVQAAIDALLNQIFFLWLGAVMPWPAMQEIDSGWRLVTAACSVILFGRLPAIMVGYRVMPEITTAKEAVFAGWFGPMGVGAVFYVQVALPYFAEDDSFMVLATHLKPIVYAMALSSTAVHGITIPIVQLWSRTSPLSSSLARGISRVSAEGYVWLGAMFRRDMSSHTSRRMNKTNPCIDDSEMSSQVASNNV